MIYYRCKCGKLEAWMSGMVPNPCGSYCFDCNTVLATNPDNHEGIPQPHDFSYKEKVDTDEGVKTNTRCKYCLLTVKQAQEQCEHQVVEDGECKLCGLSQ